MWSQITGHSRQIEELKRALSSGRLPNAYLFTGPRGVGKWTIAKAFASAVVCDGGEKPCGACAACRKAASNTHPDVFAVMPEASQPDFKPQSGKDKKPSEEIKIEQMRDLQAKLQFHPLEARAKIAIVDEAERMTASTANSLLKILEEPPPATHFILISTLPHLILPTIRSRCRQMAFGPLPEDLVAKILSEKNGASHNDAVRIARLSGGSLGIALSIAPEFISDVMARFGALMKKGNSADAIATAEGWSHTEPQQMRLIFDLMASWYRDCLRYRATGDAGSLIHHEAQAASANIAQGEIERAISEIEKSRRAMDGAANKQLMFENLLFTLTS